MRLVRGAMLQEPNRSYVESVIKGCYVRKILKGQESLGS
jgi:hypothetical protein